MSVCVKLYKPGQCFPDAQLQLHIASHPDLFPIAERLSFYPSFLFFIQILIFYNCLNPSRS